MIVKPQILAYGNSFGEYQGSRLTDYQISSYNFVDLNNRTFQEGVEFNHFEKTIKDYCFAKLGSPTIRVELTPFQVKIAIEEAVTKLQYHAPSWATQFTVFEATANVDIYEIPSFILNSLVNVVYRRNLLTIGQPGSLEFDFFYRYFQDNRLFSSYNIGEFYLMQMYMKQMRKVLSNHGTWDVIDGKYLQIHPTPSFTGEAVIVEYKALNSDTIHPYYKNWLQRYTLALCKETLGRVRSKYDTLPGPGGGARLDGMTLLEEAKEEKEKLQDELLYEIEEPAMFRVC